MEKLKINKLRIETHTEAGLYGTEFEFDHGLNIIHADNTHGKSTCIQSIVYALGLEGALGPSRAKPLKPVLTRELRDESGRTIKVKWTSVFLEIENNQNKVITLERSSKAEKSNLIKVRECCMDNIINNQTTPFNYHVRQAGSATYDRGFHSFLTSFLGLKLPLVQKFNGEETLLYLEAVFSVNYVEQIRGWGGILNLLPTYLQIRDLPQRVLEFSMALDVMSTKAKRQKLLSEKSDLEKKWTFYIERIQEIAISIGGIVSRKLPESMTKKLEIEPISYIHFLIEEKRIVSFEEEKQALEDRLQSIKKDEYQKKKLSPEIESQLEKNLQDLKTELDRRTNAYEMLREDIRQEEIYIESVGNRITSLEENLRKYDDIRKLRKVGSELQLLTSNNVCPTCLSEVEDSLISYFESNKHRVLSVDDNIKYLNNQRKVYNQLLSEENRRIVLKKERLKLVYDQVKDVRSKIKDIRDQLTLKNPDFNRKNIKEEALLEYKIENFEKAERREKEAKENLTEILNAWKSKVSEIEKIPSNNFSKGDLTKIKTLQSEFKDNLSSFGYSSGKVEGFKISLNNYKPTLEDVEISSEASASDNIRIIWSYLYSLLTLDIESKLKTNHIGLLILDEPRQQDAKIENFGSFIKKASETKTMKKQIIIGTSEQKTNLKDLTKDIEIKIYHFDSDIIKPLSFSIVSGNEKGETIEMPNYN